MRSKITGNKRGFTLVEVMIVLAVIGIMAAIAVPNFMNWLPNMHTRAEARDLFSALQKAKMEAVRTNTTVNFEFVATAGGVAGGYTFSNGVGVNITGVMQNSVSLRTNTNFPNGVLPTTLPVGATGAIEISHPDATRSYKITQTFAGGFRIKTLINAL